MSFRQDNIFIDITEDVLRATDVLTQKGPVKRIRGDGDLLRWVRSHAFRDLISYINNTSIALQGYRLTGSFPVSEQMQRLCDMFDVLERPLIKQTQEPSAASTPELKSASYRVWLRNMFHIVLDQLAGSISAEKCNHIHELGEYLRRSFGNATTLEFGPGNELMFLFFLCGLFRASILESRDTVAAALMLLYRYIHLVRRLIAIYDLPMASNPRCSIEDYFFVPYLWGAAQLCLKAPFPPLKCDQPEAIERHRQDYMMVNLIENLPDKTGPLCRKAFQLWCILSLPTWPDVYRGLERCYINHVLASFHTVENAVFWELMSFDLASSEGVLHRPVIGQDYLNSEDVDEEGQVTRSAQQRKVSESSWPVRLYASLNLLTGLIIQPKQSEEESNDEEGCDRIAMLRPTTVASDHSGDLDAGERLSGTPNSNFSDETKFFMSQYD